jgi:hypothetical protein
MPIKTEMPTPFPISKAVDSETTSAVPRDMDVSALLDPDGLLLQLSSEEKIKLLSGDDMWHTVPVPRLGIPRVRVSSCSSSVALPPVLTANRCPMDPMESEGLLVSTTIFLPGTSLTGQGPTALLQLVSLVRRVWLRPLTSTWGGT